MLSTGDSEAFLRFQTIFKILRWKLNILKYWRYRWICQTGQTVLWLWCAFTKLELDLIKCEQMQHQMLNQSISAISRKGPIFEKFIFFSIWHSESYIKEICEVYEIFFRKSIAHQFLNLKHILCQDISELCLLEKRRFK